jgi:hypothetical protein
MLNLAYRYSASSPTAVRGFQAMRFHTTIVEMTILRGRRGQAIVMGMVTSPSIGELDHTLDSSILLARFLVCSTSEQSDCDAFGNLFG